MWMSVKAPSLRTVPSYNKLWDCDTRKSEKARQPEKVKPAGTEGRASPRDPSQARGHCWVSRWDPFRFRGPRRWREPTEAQARLDGAYSLHAARHRAPPAWRIEPADPLDCRVLDGLGNGSCEIWELPTVAGPVSKRTWSR